MSGYAESRAAFFSLVRSCELAHEVDVLTPSLREALERVAWVLLGDIEALEVDRYQKQALVEEVVDAVNALP